MLFIYVWTKNKLLMASAFSCLATLEIISVGAGLVKMLGVEAELFVTIDDSGVVRATVSYPYIFL